jgi:hypothetical protein
MATILLPYNYKIEVAVDGNVILKQPRISEKGLAYDNVLGYFSSVKSAIDRLAKTIAADTDGIFTLQGYLDRHTAILKELLASIEKI